MLSKVVRSNVLRVKVQAAHMSAGVPRVKNFINGKFEDSKTNEWINLYNPATGELVCQVPQSTPEELKRAEEGAKVAFQSWKEVPVQQRQVSKQANYSYFPEPS
jgi:malonate-semialdehyde dehydrogenase (acetylating)/methylmalonate-semialdehyde dehydrogenase